MGRVQESAGAPRRAPGVETVDSEAGPAPAGPVTGRWRAASAVVTENPQNHHQQASTQVYHILYSTLPLSDWQKLCPLGIRP